MDAIREFVSEYVRRPKYRRCLGLPEAQTESYEKLAQGEYNANYVFNHPIIGDKLVLRINCGSQMHLSYQVSYEAQALSFLKQSGHTPDVLYVDEEAEYGVLVETYMAGKHLDYDDDEEMKNAAKCLADIHSLLFPKEDAVYCNPESIDNDNRKMIAPVNSLEAILEECEKMFSCYENSNIADDDTKTKIRRMLNGAWGFAISTVCESPYRCCINTELNSTNFLVDGKHVNLVDWEKPLYGDPAQDLGHFLAPTTTFWKTDVVLDDKQIYQFISDYVSAVDGRFDTEGIEERTKAFILVTCMRGVTWCSMAWLEYHRADRLLKNESTGLKIEQYLSEDFLNTIESTYM